jgi:ubiquinone/menaquinone biosynthesis C-methylase UbiE
MPRYDFDRAAGTYDDYYREEFGRKIDAVEKRLVEKYLSRLGSGRLLEVGCGTGHWTEYFTGRGFRILGLDISEKMLARARARSLTGAGFLMGSAENLPFPDECFENIASMATLEFVDHQDRAFGEIRRVLKPGGFFIIGALNEGSPLGRNKQDHEILKDADFFTRESLRDRLLDFGEPEIEGCALIGENWEILDLEKGDLDPEKLMNEGAFLAGFVRKAG